MFETKEERKKIIIPKGAYLSLGLLFFIMAILYLTLVVFITDNTLYGFIGLIAIVVFTFYLASPIFNRYEAEIIDEALTKVTLWLGVSLLIYMAILILFPTEETDLKLIITFSSCIIAYLVFRVREGYV